MPPIDPAEQASDFDPWSALQRIKELRTREREAQSNGHVEAAITDRTLRGAIETELHAHLDARKTRELQSPDLPARRELDALYDELTKMPDAVGSLARALAAQGDESFELANLTDSLEASVVSLVAYRRALAEPLYSRTSDELETLQSKIGDILTRLGMVGCGTERLGLEAQGDEYFDLAWRTRSQEATLASLLAYRKTEAEPMLCRTTDERARLQTKIGHVLELLGTERHEEAATAYRLALELWVHKPFPREWAATQDSLGIILWRMGGSEKNTTRVKEAVSARRAALAVWRSERDLMNSAKTQFFMGIMLVHLSEMEAGSAWLEEAVQAFRGAVEVWTTLKFPGLCAKAQARLDLALSMLDLQRNDHGIDSDCTRAIKDRQP